MLTSIKAESLSHDNDRNNGVPPDFLLLEISLPFALHLSLALIGDCDDEAFDVFDDKMSTEYLQKIQNRFFHY